MGRIIIYGLFICLLVFAAYLYYEWVEEPQPAVTQDETSPADRLPAGQAGTGRPAQATAPPVQQANHQTPPAKGEPPKVGPQPPVAVESVAPSTSVKERASEKDREMATQAAEKARARDYEGALKIYRELSERDKSALAGMGTCYLKLGDYENAERILEQAVIISPGDFGVRKGLAFIYYKKDDIEKALLHAEAGLSITRDQELQKLCDKLRKDRNTQDVSESESTSHFRITFDGYKHGGISRKVLEILEDAYGTVGKEFGYFPSGQVNAILYTDRDFFDVTQAPAWSGGVYDGKIRIPVRGAEANEALLRKVLFHEYTHSVVRSLTPRCPLWLNEGLAEYFSRSDTRKTGQVIPLGLLESSFGWLPGNQVSVAYLESYSAVSYLIDRHGLHKMKEFLLALSGNSGVEKAFQDSFGVTYSEFVSTWGKR